MIINEPGNTLPIPGQDNWFIPDSELFSFTCLQPSGLPINYPYDETHKSVNSNFVEQPYLSDSLFSSQNIVATGSNHSNDLPLQYGCFTVGETGQVGFDYLLDGGGYKGEIAIFSLNGLEGFELDSPEFFREAARRALSNSLEGHIVISDREEGARFNTKFAWENDANSGEYLGVKSIEMTPGDHFAIMLVPNGTVQQVYDNPKVGGNIRPLFSITTANPGEMLHVGQIADVLGNGTTFALEDLRADKHSDKDFNDIIFQVRGAVGEAQLLDGVINPNKDWRSTDVGKALVNYAHELSDPTTTQAVDSTFPKTSQPLVGVIDTGFNKNNPDIDYSDVTLGRDLVDEDNNPLIQDGEGSEHGTHILGIIKATQANGIGIDGVNDDAPIWLGRAVGSDQWAQSLREFVNAAKESGQPNAVVNLSFDLTQTSLQSNVTTTRYELTPEEREAIEYARQNGILIVVAAGNDGGIMSALGQASQEFNNIITVGAVDYDGSRAEYSSYGYGLNVVSFGGTSENPITSTIGAGADIVNVTADEEMPADELTIHAENAFLETFGSLSNAEAVDEIEIGSFTPEEQQIYGQATQAIDQLLNNYLNSASQKLVLEYVDGYYDNQIDALQQFVEAFDEDLADNLVKTQELFQEAGRSLDFSTQLGENFSVPFDLGLGTMAGTSVATAKVTGAISQIWAANPGLSYLQVKEVLQQTAIDVNTPGWDQETGSGVVNLEAAIQKAKETQPQEYTPTPLLSPLTWSGEGVFTPGERAVNIPVPTFTGQILNIGYVDVVNHLKIRSGPGQNFAEIGQKLPGELVAFDAYTDNGSFVSDPYMPGGGSSRWYKIAGTNTWMSGVYIDNSPELAEQERQRQEAIRLAQEQERLAQEAIRLAQEEARLAQEELLRIEAEQRLQQDQFQAAVNQSTQRFGELGLLIGNYISNGVRIYQFFNGTLFIQPDGSSSFYRKSENSNNPLQNSSTGVQSFTSAVSPTPPAPDRILDEAEESKFQKHIRYEKLSKEDIYNYAQGKQPFDKLFQGYDPKKSKFFYDPVTDLAAVGLVPEDSNANPVLVFQGTDWKTDSLPISDTHPLGIGADQFNAAQQLGIDSWLKENALNGKKSDVIGHSLGGALAQMTTAEFSEYVNETVTYNSPGVGLPWLSKAMNFKGNVTHYIVDFDPVSSGGLIFLPGDVYAIDVPGLDKHLRANLLQDSQKENSGIKIRRSPYNDFYIDRNSFGLYSLDTGRVIAEPIRTLLGIGPNIVKTVGGFFADQIINGVDAVSSFTNSAIEAAKQKAQQAKQKADELVAQAKTAYQTAQISLHQARNAYQTFKQELAQKTTQIVQQSTQKLQQEIQRVQQQVVQTAPRIIRQVASYAKQALQSVNNVINGAKQFVSSVINTGKQIVNNVVQGAKQAYETAKTFVVNTYEAGKQAVTQAVNQAANTVNQAVNTVTNTVSSGFDGLKSMFGW